MAQPIRTAAVLGAGVMGSAIAAHLAGAGVRTHLLDILPPGLEGDDATNQAKRDGLAAGGIKKALKAKPAAFYDPDAARLITAGNMDDHLDRLEECDLVIEAVPERMEIKKSVYERIGPHLSSEAILASNTSGLSIAAMSATCPP